MELIAAVLLVIVTAVFLLQPILAGKAAPLVSPQAEPTEAQFRKKVALQQLRDVEYEYAMGKLGDADYRSLKSRLSAEALAAIRAEKEEEGGIHGDAAAVAEASEAELEREIALLRARISGGPFCSDCGRPNPAGARFCAHCGASLGAPAVSDSSE